MLTTAGLKHQEQGPAQCNVEHHPHPHDKQVCTRCLTYRKQWVVPLHISAKKGYVKCKGQCSPWLVCQPRGLIVCMCAAEKVYAIQLHMAAAAVPMRLLKMPLAAAPPWSRLCPIAGTPAQHQSRHTYPVHCSAWLQAKAGKEKGTAASASTPKVWIRCRYQTLAASYCIMLAAPSSHWGSSPAAQSVCSARRARPCRSLRCPQTRLPCARGQAAHDTP